MPANVMLPIIVNNRSIHSVKNPMQQGIIAHVSKLTSNSDGTIISNSMTNTMPTMSNTMVASIQSNQSIQSQASQGGNQSTIYTTGQQITNQPGSQIITVSQQQQQQLINQQANLHQSGNVQTVVPIALGGRTGNIPIKTITVSTSNSGSLDSAVTVHRNLTSNAGNMQATTIIPIAKLVSQHQVVNTQQNISGSQGTPVYIHTRIPTVSTVASSAQQSQVITVSSSSSGQTFSSAGQPTATLYYEQASLSSGGDNKTTSANSSNSESTYAVSTPANIRYGEKMFHSIIASNYQQSNAQAQQQSSVSQQNVPVRFSPLVVENPNQQSSHQIISMSTGNTVQQQATSSDAPTHMIVPISSQVPTSPRGAANIRKQNDPSPAKGQKKQPKVKNYQDMRVPQRNNQIAQIAQSITQLAQGVKPIEQKQQQQQPLLQQQQCSTASSPKTTFSERESPSQVDDWSDGSTTVSIPNSPRSEEDDLDAMILSNQFNKISEDFKYVGKSSKMGSGMKRESGEHLNSPRSKKMKHDRSMDDSVGETNNENSENGKKKDIVLKKPQVLLLQTYSQTWKQPHNHFLRHSDVRVRDERRPSVMDLANQPKVSQRVNGWKTHLISAEITEIINDESEEMKKLTKVLERLEATEMPAETEKISELIKGNSQRSRLIIESFNDSNTQLLKIFEHRDHAAEIINRCASKRNFKKR